MAKWTVDQQKAIDVEGSNVIVSAGAGSGKTAVLTARVIRKLLSGVSVDRLLILTFTKAAASEMRERIRASIIENNLEDQLVKIDSAYITTFDSFALSIVKKYHYLLNLDKNIEIANELVLKFKLDQIIDDIFDKLYDDENPLFLKLLKDFTLKDDSDFKNFIKETFNKLDLKYDKINYLNNYLDNFYNEEYINKIVLEFTNLLLSKITKIKENLSIIELSVDGDYYSNFYDALKPLLESTTYDDVKANLDIKLPRLKKGMDDIKPYKEKISGLIKKISDLAIYESESEIKTDIMKTKDYMVIIIDILKEIDKYYNEFKFKNNLFDFIDISKLAIKIVSEYESVRLELKDYFQEILIDEYQDTSDLQEEFIGNISNNNTYMVGDIKQSIYRFRNANPNLFKEKYNNYKDNLGGVKIDLVKNFRSREETLQNINYIFNYIMDLEIGGADYKESHQMVFGNTSYNDYKGLEQDYNFQIYNYNLENKEFSKDEVEAFIVANDIKNKYENHYQVFDKDKKILRDITYDDFVILMDKSKSFELYKKIFEYLGIPLTILKEEKINGSSDLFILKNILVLLKSYQENKFDTNFSYAYLSVARSYLFMISDKETYQVIKTHDFKDNIVLKPIMNILDKVDTMSLSSLLDYLITEYDFYNKIITVGNIKETLIRLDYFKELASSLENLGYTYLDFLDYLEAMILKDETIKYSTNKDVKNSVKIMTIHKSKGLEYHICYYPGLTSGFDVRDSKKRFVYDNTYGIITPIFDNGIKPTIYHSLYKDLYIKEDISERIRLFYVALTRAKEKMILVTSLKDNTDNESDELVDMDTRLKYKSFASILNSISDKLEPYIKNVDLNSYNLTKDYNNIKEINIIDNIEKTTDKLKILELSSNNDLITSAKFSKTNKTFVTTSDKNKLEFGEFIHYLFEITDFKTKDLSLIPDEYKVYLTNFLNSDLLKDINNANIYKEYEFIYNDNNIEKHGIIDLMLEYQDRIDIIDYKLKHIDDENYLLQLEGYKNYIKTKTNKDINLYLYSILDNRFELISKK